MKVLAAIVIPPHLSVSGAANAAEALSAALASRCEITVGNMMQPNPIDADVGKGRKVRRIPVESRLPPVAPWSKLPNRAATLFYRSSLPDIIRQGGYDLVHLHNPMPALELERCAKACWERGIPYVISTHGFNEIANGIEVYGFGSLGRTLWRRLVQNPVSHAVQKADAVFALSPADYDIVREMGFRGADLRVVSNGVEKLQAPDPAGDRAILAQLEIPVSRTPSQITCLFLANHTRNKGLPVLLEALTSLDIPYLMLVAGETRPDIDYDRYVRHGDRPDQSILVLGRRSDREIAALFRRSDLFIFPSLADTFPLAILEAMAHGLPVLASNVGGIPYQVDERCGMLVPPGDPLQLAAAIKTLAQDPRGLVQMGETARAQVAARFTWERAAEQAFAGYCDVLERRARAGGQPFDRNRSSLS